MKIGNFIEGLNILREHYKDRDGYHLGAEHDIIYIYATDTPLSAEEVARLKELNFFQPEVSNDEGEWVPELYDASEGWAVFP